MKKFILLLALLALSAPLHAECLSTAYETDFSQYDMNNDGVVNLSDFSIFRSVYGSHGELGDFNGDGVVDYDDFLLFRDAFGMTETVIVVRCEA